MSHPDVIVIGLGAMGSASLYQLAARGVRVLGIDRFSPPHTQGSSHGETRITRLVTGEGAAFVPIVRRSHELWRELEAASGETLFTQTGVLFLASGGSEWGERVVQVAEGTNTAHQRWNGDEIAAHYPQFQLQGAATGLFDPAGGALFPERCVQAQLQLAQQHGAEIRTNETVLAVQSSADGVSVITDQGVYHAAKVVLTAGPWLPGLLGGALPQVLRVYRQVLYWFAAKQPRDFAPERFPVFIWSHGPGRNNFYGFPTFTPDGTVKVATSQLITESSPDAVDRVVTSQAIAEMFEQHIAGHLPGLTASALRTATCLYTVTPDGNFVFDQHPAWANVLLVSACSGHGFKHSAAIGEAVAQRLLDGRSDLDLSSFTLARFQEFATAA